MNTSVKTVATGSGSSFEKATNDWRLSMTYRGPMLIAEPKLRWPIVLLAAVITALLAILAAGLYYVAMALEKMTSVSGA